MLLLGRSRGALGGLRPTHGPWSFSFTGIHGQNSTAKRFLSVGVPRQPLAERKVGLGLARNSAIFPRRSTLNPWVKRLSNSTTKSNGKQQNAAAANKKREREREMLRSMLSYIWPSGPGASSIKARVVLALFLLIGGKLFTVAVPFVFKSLVDTLNEATKKSSDQFISAQATASIPVALVIIYGIARAGGSAFQELRNAVFAAVSQQAIRKVARNVFLHLHSMDLSFHLNRQTGKLSRVIDRGGRSIDYVLSSLVFRVFPTGLELLMVSGLLWMKCGPQYAGVTFLTLAAYVWFTINVTQWRTVIRRDMNQLENEASAKVVDSLINYETVKYFTNDMHEANRYDQSLKGFEKASLKTQTSLAFLNFGQNAIFSVGLTAMMYLAANEIANGTMTVGDIVLVNGLLFQLSVPLNFVGSVYRELRQAFIDMDEMFLLKNQVSKLQESPNAVTLNLQENTTQYKDQEIVFKDVWFAYDPKRPILQGLNLTIPRGKTVALVGPSGCGKSTILRLLFRFYDVESGSISIHGHDVRDLTLDSLRKNIGVIPQDTVMFNDTLYYNIAYGDIENATKEKVEQVVKMANLQSLVDILPDGYDTPIGERGLILSGGERQRVAISRAMLKNAPILLVDEGTSALDSKTSKQIMESLQDLLLKDRTSILVAHRLSTIKHADQIIVLDQGKVKEQGTHNELLAKHGLYYSLWNQEHQHDEILTTNGKT